jgi:hypothetical protein
VLFAFRSRDEGNKRDEQYHQTKSAKGDVVDIQSIVSELKLERDRLSSAIAALEGIETPGTRVASPAKPQQKKRRRRGGLTPEGRKRLSEMMKKRWAKKRRKTR